MAEEEEQKAVAPAQQTENKQAETVAEPVPEEPVLSDEDYLDPRVVDMTTPSGARDLEAVYDISVRVSAVLGKSVMPVGDLLKLGRGSKVDLDRKVGEAIDIYVNNRLVARGEVVVVDDKLGVTMTEIVKSDRSS